MANQILSAIFLLGLFYTRFIPLAIFWHLYYPLFQLVPQKKLFHELLAGSLILVSYFLALLTIISLPVAVLNYFLLDSSPALVPILLLNSESAFGYVEKGSLSNSLFSFLLNNWLIDKKKSLLLKTAATGIEIFALMLTMLGGIEVYNDYNSHVSPDFLDFLFPENGAVMFWGGIALLTLIHFYLYFLEPIPNLIKRKKYLLASRRISEVLRDLIISPSLHHPYFFMTQGGRLLARESKISEKKLILLLKKAFIENKNLIPDEWIKKIAKN